MKVLYNYKPYQTPKVGLFHCETGLYQLPVGWVQEEQEHEIIGETADTYVYRLAEHTCCDTTKKTYGKKMLLPMGVHKSRLVTWVENKGVQLKLFN